MQSGTISPRGVLPKRENLYRWPDPADNLGLRRRLNDNSAPLPSPPPDDTPPSVPHRTRPIVCCDGLSHCIDHSRWYFKRLLHKKTRQSDIEQEPREYFKWVLIELLQATQERRERLCGIKYSTPSKQRRSVDPPHTAESIVVTPTLSPPPSYSANARRWNSPRHDPVETRTRSIATRLTWRADPPVTTSARSLASSVPPSAWDEAARMELQPQQSWRNEFQQGFVDNSDRVRNGTFHFCNLYGKRLLVWFALLLLVLYLLNLEPKSPSKPKRLTPTWVDLTNYV